MQISLHCQSCSTVLVPAYLSFRGKETVKQLLALVSRKVLLPFGALTLGWAESGL